MEDFTCPEWFGKLTTQRSRRVTAARKMSSSKSSLACHVKQREELLFAFYVACIEMTMDVMVGESGNRSVIMDYVERQGKKARSKPGNSSSSNPDLRYPVGFEINRCSSAEIVYSVVKPMMRSFCLQKQ